MRIPLSLALVSALILCPVAQARERHTDAMGRTLGYSEEDGRGGVRYYDPQNRSLGRTERSGSSIIRRDSLGRTIERREERQSARGNRNGDRGKADRD